MWTVQCLPLHAERDTVTERTNEQWLAALRAQRGPERDAALADLRVVLVRGLKGALDGRSGGVSGAAVEDFAQEALVKILHNLDSFRGESRFTTWARKIAVRVAFTELRRKKWQDVSLQELVSRYGAAGLGPAALKDPMPTPESLTAKEMMLTTLRRLILEELTDRQREALVAVMLNGMPLEEAARRMDTNRNALYKLLHDARRRLKECLISEGLSSYDVLAMLDEK